MKVTAIVPSAGKGARLKGRVKKPFLALNGKPILARTLSALNKSGCVDEIILAVNSENLDRARGLVKKYKLNKVKKIVKGGAERSDSVYNGLRSVDDAGIVLVHDGVRPFVTQDLIKRCVAAARRFGASCAGVPVTQTVKKVFKNGVIHSTPKREEYYFAQTPQVFKTALLKKAYKNYKKLAPTDDASLVERSGAKVKIVLGSYDNIKITTPEDLALAKLILKK